MKRGVGGGGGPPPLPSHQGRQGVVRPGQHMPYQMLPQQ